MTEIILIDADILLYKATTSVEKAVEWDDDLWVMWCDHREAKDAFKQMLDGILDHVPGATPYLCLTHDHNFRKDVYPLYKSNRKATRKPMGYPEFKAWVMGEYTTIIKPSIEADDCIGILATKPKNNAIVYSGDKDLMQIPGKHLIDGKIKVVSEEEGTHLFYMQTLTGDQVDGYPGCPGIGKVKAEKILQEAYGQEYISPMNPVWSNIVAAYAKAELTEEDALTQARCARILRWNDWDQKEQKVKLWVPTTV